MVERTTSDDERERTAINSALSRSEAARHYRPFRAARYMGLRPLAMAKAAHKQGDRRIVPHPGRFIGIRRYVSLANVGQALRTIRIAPDASH